MGGTCSQLPAISCGCFPPRDIEVTSFEFIMHLLSLDFALVRQVSSQNLTLGKSERKNSTTSLGLVVSARYHCQSGKADIVH